MSDYCNWSGCRADSVVGYAHKAKKVVGMCGKHWSMFCEWQDKDKENEARARLGLQPIQREVIKAAAPVEQKAPLPTVQQAVVAEAADTVDSPPVSTNKVIRPARRVGKRIPKGCQ